MALDEAALDTLGLATLWVRRGAKANPGVRAADPLPASTHEYERAKEAQRAALPDQGQALMHGRAPASGQVVAAPAPIAARGQQALSGSTETGDRDSEAKHVADATAWDEIDRPLDETAVDTPLPATPASARARADGEGEIAMLDWSELEACVSACERCRLCEKRTNTVFGVGDRAAEWMLIGEAPGENEDKQGEPFVGQAGRLLDSMMRALALARGENVYIANVVKCRPPGNRNPEPDEAASCEPYLRRQVALVKPRLIFALGRVAAQNLLKTDASISSLRGRVHRYEDVPVIVTYHPAYLLRSLQDKAKAWADLCLADATYRELLAEQKAAR